MWITISGFLSHSYPHIQYSICLLLKTKRLSGPGGHFSLPSRLCVTFWPPRPLPPAPRPAHLFQTESVPTLEPTAESDVSNWGWQDARSREDAAASPAGRAWVPGRRRLPGRTGLPRPTLPAEDRCSCRHPPRLGAGPRLLRNCYRGATQLFASQPTLHEG